MSQRKISYKVILEILRSPLQKFHLPNFSNHQDNVFRFFWEDPYPKILLYPYSQQSTKNLAFLFSECKSRMRCVDMSGEHPIDENSYEGGYVFPTEPDETERTITFDIPPIFYPLVRDPWDCPHN